MNFDAPIRWNNGIQINTVTTTPGGGGMSGYLVRDFDPSRIDVVGFLDKRGQQDGMDASDVFLGARHPELQVEVFGSTHADFHTKAQALVSAFTPTLLYDATDLGFEPLTFSQLTTDTTNWPTGSYPDGIPMLYFLRPKAPPRYSYNRDTDGGATAKGLSKVYSVSLLAKDPRKYSQLEVAHTITSSFTTATNVGDYPTFPTITIATASTTGALALTIGSSLFTVTLNATSTTFVVDCAAATFEKAGVLAMDLITTGTTFPELAPGGTAVKHGGLTGVTVTMAYRHAWV